MADDKHLDHLSSKSITTEHIKSSRDDENILIGGDLMPDDNDMYPRNIGSREEPFRLVYADTFVGNIEPNGDGGFVGYHQRPFKAIFAKTLKGNLEGTVNGMTFPGNINGFGWILLNLSNHTGKTELEVIRSSFPKTAYDQPVTNGTTAYIQIHPVPPALMFVMGKDVYAEIMTFSCDVEGVDAIPKTTFRRLSPQKKGTNAPNEITLSFSLPDHVSMQQTILVRLI